MGEVVSIRGRSRPEKRRRGSRPAGAPASEDFRRGQQILANAIFHWKDDPSDDARAGVQFLMRHLATQFRADDAPLQPQAVAPGRAARGERPGAR